MRSSYIRCGLIIGTGALLATTLGTAQQQDGRGKDVGIVLHDDGRVEYAGVVFDDSSAFAASSLFRESGLRCMTDVVNAGHFLNDRNHDAPAAREQGGSTADCSSFFTNPAAMYDPSVVKYRVPVVVHVIRNSAGTLGNVPMSMVESQIDILNEDFLALPGTNGSAGTDVQIEFYLATEDPIGNPTTGVTYSNNDIWYNDGGGYYNTLAWDTTRYLNIYTNNTSGLGYAFVPWSGTHNTDAHRVVIYYPAFGRNSPFPPYDQGRTVTHEVGHYFGLVHTFSNPTCSAGSCYSNGDLICDTNTETSSNFGCADENECSTIDPFHNYMNYSDDLCMTEFTPDQARRMRCSLEHYFPSLYDVVVACPTDVVSNGSTDVSDLLAVLSNWGACPGCPADVDGSGVVDVTDLLNVLTAWGPCP